MNFFPREISNITLHKEGLCEVRWNSNKVRQQWTLENLENSKNSNSSFGEVNLWWLSRSKYLLRGNIEW